jgi:hypothetical protein
MAGAGMSLPVIGKLLGHAQPATTARYAHLAADPVRAAANKIGKTISEAMTTHERRPRPRLDPVVLRKIEARLGLAQERT